MRESTATINRVYSAAMEIWKMLKERDGDRADVTIDGEAAEFEFVDWADCPLEDRKKLCAYFFTFEDESDFEGIAGAAWLTEYLPIAITGDIDDDTHGEWDDVGGGGLLLRLSDGAILYYYHEMDDRPRVVAASFEALVLEWSDEEEDDDD